MVRITNVVKYAVYTMLLHLDPTEIAVHVASERGDVDTLRRIRELIVSTEEKESRGVIPIKSDAYGETPLHKAASNGQNKA